MVTFVTGNNPSGYEENIGSTSGDVTGTTLVLEANQTGLPITVRGTETLRYSASIGGIGGTGAYDQIAGGTVWLDSAPSWGWERVIINPTYDWVNNPGGDLRMILTATNQVGDYYTTGLVDVAPGQNFYTATAEGQEMIVEFSIQLRRPMKLNVPRVVHVKRLQAQATFLVAV